MRENSILSRKNSFILSSGCDMINVSINGSYSLEIVNFCDAFRPLEVFRASLSVAHSWRVLVLLVGDNVVANAVEVVCGGECGGFGAPRVRRRRVLLVFGLLDHAIEQVLEGSLLRRRLRADMVCRAPGEGLRLVAETLAVQLAVGVQSEVEGALGGAVGHFALRHAREVLLQRDGPASLVHRLNGISPDKVGEVLDWVDACVALFTLHEATVGPHGFRLRCVSLVLHFFSYTKLPEYLSVCRLLSL